MIFLRTLQVAWIASVNGGVSVSINVVVQFKFIATIQVIKMGISSDRVMSIYCAGNSDVWIGTLDRGVDLFQPGENSFLNYRHVPASPWSLGNGAIFSIFEDGGGNIWFGTSSGGVSKSR